ncbi:OmpA family protein [Robertkochia solimangrovi]|uniref:OmpA family protein n=1 Tax=Robertkochia solimangrovi TaxID=2213046 RepID=UPI00117DBEA7|nr:OmpA family protein [Robertkochia solimangrovi]TRZ42880.1 flagellar motor protein MotB [Robertkochia solimangrovi]
MKTKLIVLLIGALLFQGYAQAQYGRQKKADALFNKFSFIEAADTYKELIANDYNTDYAYRKLADCYFMMRDAANAEKYYAKVVQQENIPIEYYYNYAVVLRGMGKYEASEEWAKKYRKAGGDGKLVRELKDGIQQTNLMESSTQYEIEEAPFNTKYSDFGAYVHGGQVYFVSARPTAENSKKIYSWNQQPFLEMFTKDADGTISPVQGDINSKYHEGPLSISPDGKTMYFSRNNYLNKKTGKDDDGVSNLKIYQAKLIDGMWQQITDLPFNSDDYSVSHPSLSPDGKTLFFSSDMPGGYGKADLYKVAVHSDGSFGELINLGETVNTEGNEVFPFVNKEHKLFFSSDGHPGYGLLDIFVALSDNDGGYTEVLNLGKPINSIKDEISFFMADDGYSGYFSSNRNEEPQNDDIYTFEKILPLMLRGHVRDSVNSQPIANARVALLKEDQEIAYLETDENGYYEINIDRDSDYSLAVTHPKYNSNHKVFTSKGISKRTTEIVVDVLLSPVLDLHLLADLNTIYFDFDRYNIREDAAKELDKVIRLMNDTYPNMVMRLEAHTDSRGSASYNDKLSIDRANSTYDYLVSHGLSRDRVIAHKGYGETRLTNGCVDGVHCEEPQHQKNRRTEFIIVSMDGQEISATNK